MNVLDAVVSETYFDGQPPKWLARCRHCGVLLETSDAPIDVRPIGGHLCSQLEQIQLLRSIRTDLGHLARRQT